jgi:hypothetical protein
MVLRFRREHYKSLSHQRLRGKADDAIERKSRRPGLLVKSGHAQIQNGPVPETCSYRTTPVQLSAAIPGFAGRLRQRQLLRAVCDEPIAPQSRNPKRGGGATLGVPLD